jgi:outer membrane protein assembly factor BamB
VLQAIDLVTGSVLWRSDLAPARRLVVSDGRVVVAAAETLEAVSAETGASLWRVPLASRPVSPPLVAGGVLLLALASGEVLAVSGQDGARRWSVSAGAEAGGPLALADSTVFVGLADGSIVALSTATGSRVWEQKLGGRATGLLVARGRVYAGALDNFFYCLDARDGRVRWRWRTGADVVGEPAIDARFVYFVSLDNLVRALDRDSGVQRWKKPLPARPVIGPTLVGDTLLLAGVSPELRALRAATGESVGRYGMEADLGAAPLFIERQWPGADLVAAMTDGGTLLLLGRRLAPGLAPLSAMPGVALDVSLAPPPQ